MAFFVWTISGWNLAITGLSVVEFYFLHDLRLPVLAVTCWGLGVAALYHKRRLDRAIPGGHAARPGPLVYGVDGGRCSELDACQLDYCSARRRHCPAVLLLLPGVCGGDTRRVIGFLQAGLRMVYHAAFFVSHTAVCLYTHTAIYVVIAVTTPGVLLFTWILGGNPLPDTAQQLVLQLENQQLIQSLIEQKEAAQAARTAAEHANLAKSVWRPPATICVSPFMPRVCFWMCFVAHPA